MKVSSTIPAPGAVIAPAGSPPADATGGATGDPSGFSALLAAMMAGAGPDQPVSDQTLLAALGAPVTAPTPTPAQVGVGVEVVVGVGVIATPTDAAGGEEEASDHPETTDDSVSVPTPPGATPVVGVLLGELLAVTVPVATAVVSEPSPTANPSSTSAIGSIPTPGIGAGPGAVSTAAPTGGGDTETGQQSSDTPTPAEPPSATGAVTAPNATGDASATEASAASTKPVSNQLFEQIEKVVTSQNGTHRMTVRLDPGTLGEVRVHLTVRNGEVHVRLSAGADAQAALGQGAGDLRRLLEGAGTGAVRVDVRGLETGRAASLADAAAALTQPTHTGPQAHRAGGPGTAEALAATALTTGTDNGAGSATGGASHDLLGARQGSGWTGGDTGSTGAHAGRRGTTDARDGDQDRVEGLASDQPRTSGPRGLDVQM